MKKVSKYLITVIIVFISLFFVGCHNQSVKINFIRFELGKRQETDYYLDFTIKIKNNEKYKINIDNNDFVLKVNNNDIVGAEYLSEYENVYIGKLLVEAKQQINIRVRFISNLNKQEWNSIQLKYKDNVIIEDRIYI